LNIEISEEMITKEKFNTANKEKGVILFRIRRSPADLICLNI